MDVFIPLGQADCKISEASNQCLTCSKCSAKVEFVKYHFVGCWKVSN